MVFQDHYLGCLGYRDFLSHPLMLQIVNYSSPKAGLPRRSIESQLLRNLNSKVCSRHTENAILV